MPEMKSTNPEEPKKRRAVAPKKVRSTKSKKANLSKSDLSKLEKNVKSSTMSAKKVASDNEKLAKQNEAIADNLKQTQKQVKNTVSDNEKLAKQNEALNDNLNKTQKRFKDTMADGDDVMRNFFGGLKKRERQTSSEGVIKITEDVTSGKADKTTLKALKQVVRESGLDPKANKAQLKAAKSQIKLAEKEIAVEERAEKRAAFVENVGNAVERSVDTVTSTASELLGNSPLVKGLTDFVGNNAKRIKDAIKAKVEKKREIKAEKTRLKEQLAQEAEKEKKEAEREKERDAKEDDRDKERENKADSRQGDAEDKADARQDKAEDNEDVRHSETTEGLANIHDVIAGLAFEPTEQERAEIQADEGQPEIQESINELRDVLAGNTEAVVQQTDSMEAKKEVDTFDNFKADSEADDVSKKEDDKWEDRLGKLGKKSDKDGVKKKKGKRGMGGIFGRLLMSIGGMLGIGALGAVGLKVGAVVALAGALGALVAINWDALKPAFETIGTAILNATKAVARHLGIPGLNLDYTPESMKKVRPPDREYTLPDGTIIREWSTELESDPTQREKWEAELAEAIASGNNFKAAWLRLRLSTSPTVNRQDQEAEHADELDELADMSPEDLLALREETAAERERIREFNTSLERGAMAGMPGGASATRLANQKRIDDLDEKLALYDEFLGLLHEESLRTSFDHIPTETLNQMRRDKLDQAFEADDIGLAVYEGVITALDGTPIEVTTGVQAAIELDRQIEDLDRIIEGREKYGWSYASQNSPAIAGIIPSLASLFPDAIKETNSERLAHYAVNNPNTAHEKLVSGGLTNKLAKAVLGVGIQDVGDLSRMLTMAMAESTGGRGLHNNTSTAGGAWQHVEGTWLPAVAGLSAEDRARGEEAMSIADIREQLGIDLSKNRQFKIDAAEAGVENIDEYMVKGWRRFSSAQEDLALQARAQYAHSEGLEQMFMNKYGRMPHPIESYLMHHQGWGGANRTLAQMYGIGMDKVPLDQIELPTSDENLDTLPELIQYINRRQNEIVYDPNDTTSSNIMPTENQDEREMALSSNMLRETLENAETNAPAMAMNNVIAPSTSDNRVTSVRSETTIPNRATYHARGTHTRMGMETVGFG